MSIRTRFLSIGLPLGMLAGALLAGCSELAGLLDQSPTAAFTVVPEAKVAPGSVVTLNASGSSDPQSYPLTYSWSLAAPSGSSAALDASDKVKTAFTPDVPGQYTIELTVTATSASAKRGTKSETLTATGSGHVNAPSKLTAVASATFLSISLAWSRSPDANVAYNVYRGTAPGGESAAPIGTTSTSSYTDAGSSLSGSTTYYYTVTAAGGGESDPTNEANATTVATGPIGVTLN